MMSFLKRLLSALILAPIILLIIWLGGLVFKIFIAFLMLTAFYEFVVMARFEKLRAVGLVITVLAAIYCFVAFWAAISLPIDMILLIMLAVWASDSGAYFFGKTFGGPKLAPRISPNKTISGLIGACVFPFLVLAMAFTPDYKTAAIYGLMIGCIGQVGDLSVSMLKRRVGVKDTGRIIPGHGGVLDRIDALILVLIIFWIGIEMEVISWPNVPSLF